MCEMSDDVGRSDKGFRKLLVWQKAHQLALLIYKLTEKFPKAETYALTFQLQRAAVSVPANIAEMGMGAMAKPVGFWRLHAVRFQKWSIT